MPPSAMRRSQRLALIHPHAGFLRRTGDSCLDSGMGVDLRDRARDALELVDGDPGRAVRLARAIAHEAKTRRALDAASVAERALGLAMLRLEGPDAALPHLRTAIRHGRAAGSAELAAEARMTLAITLNM